MALAKKMESLKKDFEMCSIKSCVFHHSQWEECKPGTHISDVYLIYRLFFVIYFVTALTFSVLCQPQLFHIYLTNWSFTIQAIYGILFAFHIAWKKYHQKRSVNFSDANRVNGEVQISPDVNVKPNNGATVIYETAKPVVTAFDEAKNSLDVLQKIIWALMNISFVLPHVVSIGFWLFVYEYDPDRPSCEVFRSYIIMHGSASALAFVDSFIVAIPVRRSHFVWFTLVIIAFFVFSYVYEQAGGTYRNGEEFIYSILNWRHKPGTTALIAILGTIACPGGHLVLCWSVYHLRTHLVAYFKHI